MASRPLQLLERSRAGPRCLSYQEQSQGKRGQDANTFHWACPLCAGEATIKRRFWLDNKSVFLHESRSAPAHQATWDMPLTEGASNQSTLITSWLLNECGIGHSAITGSMGEIAQARKWSSPIPLTQKVCASHLSGERAVGLLDPHLEGPHSAGEWGSFPVRQ